VLIIPALNEMFDIAQARLLAMRMHPPAVIFVMLGVTAFAGALFAGYGMASTPTRNWAYILGFAATTTIAIYVIIDLEYPRLGLIRVDAFDEALVNVRATMN
jgi:hydrogenase/urease accessory protein HupE